MIMKKIMFYKEYLNKFRLLSLSFLTVMCLLSCDEHEPLDLDIHVGYILCDDGRILSPSAFNPDVNMPVAVVFAPNTDKHQVLSVLLDELSPIAFSDTLGFDQKTSCDVDAYDGYINTVALQTSYLAGKRPETVWSESDSAYVTQWVSDPHYYGSPLGLSAISSHWFSQSDYVPSVAELGLLYISLDIVNPVIESLGGTPVSQSPDGGGCWYWTSTEVKENKQNQSWLFSMADGSRHKALKTNAYRARLIVEYNPLSINK